MLFFGQVGLLKMLCLNSTLEVIRDNKDPKLGNNNTFLVVALFSTAEFRKNQQDMVSRLEF